MADNADDQSNTSIEYRHKKERKELQAKVQALKKAAKNDKSKKKELTAEIARLEAEMDLRHANEIENLKAQVIAENVSELKIDSNERVEDIARTKMSKAQKRRDKKIQQEREREEQIKLQEKQNVHGPRNREIQDILSRLKNRGLSIYSIASDGDCLYKAISHQIFVKKHEEKSVKELRQEVASYIKNNKDDFIPFLSNPETFEMLTDCEFDEYCEKICNTKVWGGQVEIRALSNILKCPITVIQATGPEAIHQGSEYPEPSLIITYHRHMYSLGEHYNSTQIQDETITTQD